MKRKFVVYNDLHIGSLYEIPLKFEKDAIYNGDILDFAGVHKNDLHNLEGTRTVLEAFAGERYNHGNHECSFRSMMDFYVEKGVVFTHGHRQVWGREKSLKWASRKKGVGKFKQYLSLWFNKLRHLKKVTLKEKTLERCWHLAKNLQCSVVVLGHRHPEKIVEELYTKEGKTIRVLVLPRGRNVIEV